MRSRSSGLAQWVLFVILAFGLGGCAGLSGILRDAPTARLSESPPALATERTTLPQAQQKATDEARRVAQPQAQQAVGVAERPKLQETFPRAKVEKKEEKAFAGGPGGFFIGPEETPVGGDTRRRARR